MDTLLVAQKSLDLLHILKKEFDLKPDETIAVLNTAKSTIESVIVAETMKTIIYQALERGAKL